MRHKQKWSQTINSKREKYMKDIRQQQRRTIIQSNRQWNQNPPAVALIPFMLQQKDFQNFQEILDSIDQSTLYIVDEKYKTFIQQQFAKNQNEIIHKNLFRLVNRLKIQKQNWLEQAIQNTKQQKCLQNKQLLIKQIAYHLQQSLQENKKLQNYFFCQQLSVIIFQKIEEKQFSNPSLFYRLEIVSKITWPTQNSILWIQKLLILIDKSLKTRDSFLISKSFELILALNPQKQNGKKIIKLKNFQCILEITLSSQTQTQIVIKGIQILSQLIAGEDQVINQVISYSKLFDIFKKFKGHIFDQIRMKIYWAFSNIAANQFTYHHLDEKINQIYISYENQPKQRVKMQIKFTILNYICNITEQNIQIQIQKLPWIFDFLRQSLEDLYVQNFLTRVLFAIYSIICKSSFCKVKFNEIGTKSKLQDLYNKIKNDEQVLKMLENTIQKLKESEQKEQ